MTDIEDTDDASHPSESQLAIVYEDQFHQTIAYLTSIHAPSSVSNWGSAKEIRRKLSMLGR